MSNVDHAIVDGFGDQWSMFDQASLTPEEHRRLFDAYFSIFPFEELPPNAEGFDLGCGTGRWAVLVADRVGLLHCIEPAEKALAVARRKLEGKLNARFHLATSETMSIQDGSQDFGYCLGVLHYIPNAEAAMADCVRKLKPNAPFLVYMYYRFDDRPAWFRTIWSISDWCRRGISRLPFGVRRLTTTAIAALVYLPLARTARLFERMGADVEGFPLSAYRNASFYTMRTDSLDRFGSTLEHRFSRVEVTTMMTRCGLTGVQFREQSPYWVACGRRAAKI